MWMMEYGEIVSTPNVSSIGRSSEYCTLSCGRPFWMPFSIGGWMSRPSSSE